MPDTYAIVPPAPDELDVGTTATPVQNVILKGSVNDASGNASTAAQIKGAVTHAAGTGSPHTAAGVGADAAGTAAAAIVTHVGLTDPHTQYQKESEKGALGGYASLDGAGLIPSSQMPPIAISEFLGIVASEVAMLALTGEKGDWCVRSDTPTRTFIIIANNGHLITDWQALYTPAAPVLSVNTQTGAVSLTYSDVGAAATSHVHAGTDITTGTLDGDRLPATSTTKKGGVPATGTPTGLFLRDDGTWAAAGAGTVTSVTASVPLTSSGGTTPNLALGTAAAPTTADALADVIWGASATTKKALVLQAKAGQTASMFCIQDSAGVLMSAFGATGMLGIRMAPSGNSALSIKTPTSPITLGTEKVTNGTFASDTGWTHDASWVLAGDGFAAHTAGTATVLTQNVATVSGTYYILTFTITGQTAGTVTVAIGTAYSYLNYVDRTVIIGVKGNASGSVAFSFTPTSAFDGKISLASIKPIDQYASAAIDLFSSGGTLGSEIRSGGGMENVFVGINSGAQIYNGIRNTAAGDNALRRNMTGNYNTVMGSQAAPALVTGNSNTVIGYGAFYTSKSAGEMTVIGSGAAQYAVDGCSGSVIIGSSAVGSGAFAGNYTTAIGWSCARALTTATYTTALGCFTLDKVTTGGFNVAVGNHALSNVVSGACNTAIGRSAGLTTTGSYGVYLGYMAGYYETLGSKLYIDNAQRASEADGRAKALIYGVFDAAVANQSVTINGRLGVQTSTFGTVNKVTVNPSVTTDNAACVQITASADANKPLVLQRFSATQSANLAEYQASTGAVLGAVDKNGQRIFNVISAAGATPVDSDVAAWGNDTMGIVKGTGGRIFQAFKNATDVYYVEMTAI